MANRIPPVSELAALCKTKIEAQINQTVPSVARSFVAVISVAWAMLVASLYRYANERIKQALAILATGTDLDRLGAQYGITRTTATATVIEATLTATDPAATVPATCSFVGQSNGLRYFPDGSYTPTAGVIYMTLTAENTGAGSNIDDGAAMDIAFQVAGANTVALVASTTTAGADAESDDDYRIRVLAAIRSPGGGANASDFRKWATETPGVRQAYPFAGKPYPLTGAPPDRTVYIEADTNISPNRTATAGLVASARTYITTDPITGLARQPLGLTDNTLYVESVTLRTFFVAIRNLSVDPAQEAQAKADIEAALTNYFLAAAPFVVGVDFASDRNDTFTNVSVSAVVSDILRVSGGSAESVSFGLSVGDVVPVYTLNPGELALLSDINGVIYL